MATKSFAHPAGELKLSSPVSIRKLVSFGALFLVIEITGAIGKRYLGHYGVVIVSLLGGLVSSVSTTAAGRDDASARGENSRGSAGGNCSVGGVVSIPERR